MNTGWCLAAGAAALLAEAVLLTVHLRRGGRVAFTRLDVVTLAAVALAVWRLLPAVSPWPAFLDASWYLNTGAAIARTRSLEVAAPALEIPGEARLALVTTFADQRTVGMNVPDDSGRGFHDVIYAVPDVAAPSAAPYHPPFFASWVAAWALTRGVPGAGAAVLPWSAAYLLALAALARRTIGPLGALAAVLLVAAGPAYAYFGRTPYAETAGGALWLAGAGAMVALAGGRPRPWLAVLAGLAMGLAVLAKVDALLGVAALVGWWLACRRREGGRGEGVGLLAGLALPTAHGVWLAAGVSRLYVGLNGGGVVAIALARRWPALILAALVALALTAVLRGRAGRRRGGRDHNPRRADGAGLDLRAFDGRAAVRLAAFCAIVLLAAAWFQAMTAHGTDPPAMVTILGWAVSPLGVWAAAVGLARASDRRDPRLGPVLAVALVAVPIVLAEPAVTRSLSSAYAARRLIPCALPVAALLAASLVPAGLKQVRGAIAPWASAVATLAVCVLVAANLEQAAGPMRVQGEFGGGVHLARRLAELAGPEDVVLFASVLDGSDAGRLAPLLANLEGRTTAVVARPGRADALAPAVALWRDQGRRVLVVADDSAAVPQVTGYESEFVDETSVVPVVLAPSPLMPPRWTPYELSIVIHELVPEGDSH